MITDCLRPAAVSALIMAEARTLRLRKIASICATYSPFVIENNRPTDERQVRGGFAGSVNARTVFLPAPRFRCGYVLEPEIIELCVDWERSIEESHQITREIDRRIHENGETARSIGRPVRA